MIRYGTVCSGIGAPELAVRELDWSCSFMSEIEQFPREVLRYRFNHPLHGDFTTIQRGDYADVDVLIGGTPCQDFSVAGKRLGLDAPRGNLALEYLALARRLGVRWLVWENVPGMLSSWSDDEEGVPAGVDDEGLNNWRGFTVRQRNDFGTFLEFVGQCGFGYAWRVLDGQHFGVPQRRRRIILVGYLGNWRPAAAVLLERESLRGDITPRREEGKRIAPSLAARTRGGGGLGTDFDLDGGLIAAPVTGAARNCDLGDGLDNLVTHPLRASGHDASEDGTGRGTPIVPDVAWTLQERDHKGADSDTKEGHLIPVAFDCKASGSRGMGEGPIAPTLRAMQATTGNPNAGGQIAVAFTQNSRDEVREIGGDGSIVGALAADAGAKQQNYIAFESRFARNGRGAPDDVVPPLKAQSGETGKGDGAPLVTGPLMRVRRLTPTECERLMDFPDGWTLIPREDGSLAADSPRYKALGNSMIVGKMRWVLTRLDQAHRMLEAGDGKK